MVVAVVLLCIFSSHHLTRAQNQDLKIQVNTALLATMCTGASLVDYPPTADGRTAAKKLCESPPLHSKCNSDTISTFANAAEGQCLFTFPDVNEEQVFPFAGISIVKSDGSAATAVINVRISAFYSKVVLDPNICSSPTDCTITEDSSTLPPASKVYIKGSAPKVNLLLASALVSPRPLENSARMTSLCLQGSRCTGARASPIEVIDIVAANDANPPDSYPYPYPTYDVYNSTTFPASAERFFVRIIPLNNAPNFNSGNPMKSFVPCVSCAGLRSLEPDFGQYFTFEGGSSSVTISGLVFKDDDMFEGCNSVVACAARSVSVSIDTVTGTVRLNTLSDLSLQATGSTTLLSFTGSVDASNAAIRSLIYDVVTPNTDAASPDRMFNTQKLNGPSEAVVVTVSDQGNSGQTGFANSTFIRIPITVVAMNQAPKAVGRNPPQSLEGVTITLTGPTFSDIDLTDVSPRPPFFESVHIALTFVVSDNLEHLRSNRVVLKPQLQRPQEQDVDQHQFPVWENDHPHTS
jgi:hypothetical protein